ncbi:uncharacterized protein TRIADDRAFT_60802 [Trichoplax adhaerens]|uniref:thiopurine S-methyltransferase n=1 Tax=Trichoplax adhaerens TaxID=10228 RepID=B3S8Z9_TRIAD|nr:hypothetical protein TRIADDRAFT_60802 [Trichoplax adhaerens]EDV20859.1 hypothetical protein TRIADDRAFT_60802 [Trichoplax adhaerens]|eukprot:XP_002116800.1 hypothetical protein TRIADDRAFT_60802 [Trichoplax adhaerens]
MAQPMTVDEFNEYDSYTVQDWEKMWNDGQLGSMTSKFHPMMVKFHEMIIQSDRHNRVFVPLCGNSLDLLWLARKGCSVVGSECVAFACQNFFTENQIPYEIRALDGIDGNVYCSKDEKLDIRIFQCDHYQLSPRIVGYPLDSVWDRGAFNSVPMKRRAEYVQHMSTLLTSSATVLVAVSEYEIVSEGDANHDIPTAEEGIYIAFKPLASVELIERSITERHEFENQVMEVGEILFKVKFN